jgi:protein involved in polysaccharide export with SLBB domain
MMAVSGFQPETRTKRLRWICALARRAIVMLACAQGVGCAALTNPVADGIPVHLLPPEVLGPSRSEEVPIPLNYLRQPPPDVYRLDSGDILGVYIDTVLGERNLPPPVRFAEQGNVSPAMGYPIPVQEDGTVLLPYIKPVKVKGMSVKEARDAIGNAYISPEEILKPGKERISVTLMEPRRYHVLVVRQDAAGARQEGQAQAYAGSFVFGTPEQLNTSKRGQGSALELPAYQNDVLTALTRTGGLPGTDAKNEILIMRPIKRVGTNANNPVAGREPYPGQPAQETTYIPLRMRPGENMPFRPSDVILGDGDIVYLAAREAEVFYTGGLLLSGQYSLPRDFDLDVVQAIAYVRGPIINGAFSQNNLSGQIQPVGIGFPNPSLVTVLRRIPGKGQIKIRVDFNRALEDPNERIIIRPMDVVILQSTPAEALTQYFNSVFQYNLFGTFLRTRDGFGTAGISNILNGSSGGGGAITNGTVQ